MEYETLRFSEEGRVAVVSLLRRMKKLHEFALLGAELSECCQRFKENAEFRVLVLTGDTQETFSIGEYLKAVVGEETQFFSVVKPLAALERPVLAAVPGDAIGLGLELALACDVRIASKGAQFGLPQVKAGIIPWDGGTQRLVRTVGRAKALEMILTGEPIDGPEAYRIGLVSRLVSDDEVAGTVMKMAHDMASNSPVSMEFCKEAVIKGMDLTLEQGLRLEADLYFLMHTAGDREEGIKAFLGKRKPQFKGN